MQSSVEITKKLKSNWEEIKKSIRIESGITDISYRTWIDPLTVYGVQGNTVMILIPQDNPVALSYISKNYIDFFKVSISEFLGEMIEINFMLNKDIINNEETHEEKNEVNDQSQYLGNSNADHSNLNPKYRFDTFVVGRNNNFAHSACLAVAEAPGISYNPLFLYGGPGLGKTHLMHSIGHYIQQNNPNMKILYVSSEVFTNELIDSIKNGNNNAMTKFREKYRNIDVLLIDDIQFIIGKDATQEEFFHTFNELRNCNKQVVISSDRHPSEMEKLEERIKSRLEWGLTADIKQPDYEMRMAILRKKKELDGFDLSDEVLDYIANNFKSNIRQLEGALNKLVAYSRLTRNTPITLDVAAEQLQNMIYPDKPHEVTIQMIVEVVCDHYGISIEQMLSANRSKDISDPRMIAMYLARELTNASQQQIGAFLGKRDHATVIHGIKKIEQRIKEDESLNSQIELIKKKINPD